MSDRRLDVHFDGVRCGELIQDRRGDLRFVYGDDDRNRANATPLSLSMPLVPR